MRTVIATALLVFALQAAIAVAQSCDTLANATDEDLVRFLQQQTTNRDSDCTVLAIGRLGEHHVTSAAMILIDYLAFELPMSEAEKKGIFLQPRTIARSHPAVSALFSIGKPSLPALLSAIRSKNTDDTIRANAVLTLMTIYREDGPGGVGLIKASAVREKDSSSALLLENAAKQAVRWCLPEDKTKCVAASEGKM